MQTFDFHLVTIPISILEWNILVPVYNFGYTLNMKAEMSEDVLVYLSGKKYLLELRYAQNEN